MEATSSTGLNNSPPVVYGKETKNAVLGSEYAAIY